MKTARYLWLGKIFTFQQDNDMHKVMDTELYLKNNIYVGMNEGELQCQMCKANKKPIQALELFLKLHLLNTVCFNVVN